MEAARVMEAQQDREQRLIEMVGTYQRPLLRMCYLMLKDEELARDAVQETFLKAYRAMERFRGESSEQTWLMRIAMNTCRDMRRSFWFKHMDRRITPEDLPETAWPGESNLALTMAVMQLPPRDREVITLYYYQGMTVQEIGQALGLAQSSVSNRLKKAKERLRQELERGYDHE